jgi:GMP synthase-like glutamine amidotransferase
MHIGLLLCGHPRPGVQDRHGGFDAMFQRLLAPHDIQLTSYDVEHMAFPPGPGAHDGWLISGSRHGAYEDHPFIPPLEQFIRDAHAAAVPMVGICFGHQIIAQALGGEVVKWDGGWNIGRRTYAFDGLGDVALAAWHQDQVTRLPDGAEVIASAPGCAIAAARYPGRALTIQPHPEFDLATMGTYARVFAESGSYPADQLTEAARDAAAGTPLDRDPIARAIAAFFHDHRATADV